MEPGDPNLLGNAHKSESNTPVQDNNMANIENVKRDLGNSGVPQADWGFFLTEPEAWRCNDNNSSGLNHGVHVVLTTPIISKPLWVKTKE